MVAGSINDYPVAGWVFIIPGCQFRPVAIYLFVILIMNRKNTKGEKDSVIAVIILFLLLFLLFKHRGWVYAALAVAVISLLFSTVTHYIHSLWTFLSEILGSISGGIILTLVFIIILIPTAILKRWFGKKDIILSKKNLNSGFLERNHKYNRADMENPW
jgi:hypothetical protein